MRSVTLECPLCARKLEVNPLADETVHHEAGVDTHDVEVALNAPAGVLWVIGRYHFGKAVAVGYRATVDGVRLPD